MLAASVLVFFILILTITYAGRLPVTVPIIYSGMSIAAFVAYAIDKSAARNGQWRISENTLHVLALIGGWPGALAAQRLLRHKTSKRAFQTVFWITVAMHGVTLAWLSNPQAAHLVQFFK